MKAPVRFSLLVVVLGSYGPVLLLKPLLAEAVPVRQTEGLIHGFLVLRALNGDSLAIGDLTQVAHGDRVSADLVFRFKDGSIQEETSVFVQRGTFRLLTYHLVQKGPTFKRPTDMTLNASTGKVIVHYVDDSKEKTATDQLELPVDVANGIVTTLMNHIDPKAAKTEYPWW